MILYDMIFEPFSLECTFYSVKTPRCSLSHDYALEN